MSGANENKKSLTVKIQLPEDSENILAVNFPNTFSVKNLKDDIAKKFKILSDQLLVFQDESEIQNAQMLHELNLNDFGIIEIKLTLSDHAINEGVLLDTSVYYSSFTLPDIITVHIPVENEDGEGTTRDLVVEIENKSIKKPFIGGFIHKKTSKRCPLCWFFTVHRFSSLCRCRNRISSRIHPDRTDIRPNQEGQRLKAVPRNANHRAETQCSRKCPTFIDKTSLAPRVDCFSPRAIFQSPPFDS